MSYSKIGLELVKVVITGLFAAVLVHLLEHRRFIHGRWWDRKADAYNSIISALVAMRLSYQALLERLQVLAETAEEHGWGDEDMWEAFREHTIVLSREFEEGRKQILRAALEGDYFVSGKASDALRDLLLKLPPYSDSPNYDEEPVKLTDRIHYSGEVLRSCLKVVRAEAQKDLRVKWYSL